MKTVYEFLCEIMEGDVYDSTSYNLEVCNESLREVLKESKLEKVECSDGVVYHAPRDFGFAYYKIKGSKLLHTCEAYDYEEDFDDEDIDAENIDLYGSTN